MTFGKQNGGDSYARVMAHCGFYAVCLSFAFYAIFLISRHKTKLIIVSSMLIGLISFWMGRHEIFVPLWGDAALTALPFFLFGYILRNKSNILYEPFGKKHCVICVLSISVLMFIYLYNSDFERIKIELIHGDNYFKWIVCQCIWAAFVVLYLY